MERNREARRGSILGSNGVHRKRHRTSGFRGSPDEGVVELQESVRLRDRANKNRDRERERDRDRERSSRIKRRRGEKLVSNREDTLGDETSEESVNDEDDEDEGTSAVTTTGGGVRLMPGPISNHHHHHNHSSSLSNSTNSIVSNNHLQHVKTFPPGSSSSSSSSKAFRASPVWKPGDEMIGVSVPRKARSASTKRSHDGISMGREKILRQVLGSPVRQALGSTAAQISPSSSNGSFRKKLKSSGNISLPKLKPPKALPSSKPSSSNPEELEIEIAEVLYGLRTQPQGPPLKKEGRREENDRSNGDLVSTTSANNLISGPNLRSLKALAPKRKRPREGVESLSSGARNSLISAKLEMDQISSLNLEKMSGSTGETRVEIGSNTINNSQGQPAQPREMTVPKSTTLDSDLKLVSEEFSERDSIAKEDNSSPKEKESPAIIIEGQICKDSSSTAAASVSATIIKANSAVTEAETQREQKLGIDLMVPPRRDRSSPEREDFLMDQKPALSAADAGPKVVVSKDQEHERNKYVEELKANIEAEDQRGKGTGKEEPKEDNKSTDVLGLEKIERNGNAGISRTGNRLTQQTQQKQQQLETPLKENSGQSKSALPLPIPMAGWPGGIPPMGYMTPMQGVVSMDGSTVTPASMQPLFSQPRTKRCATHCYIARNIQYLQQFMKINPFWQAAAGSASLLGSNSCNLTVIPANLHCNMAGRGLHSPQDMGQTASGNDQDSQTAGASDSAPRKQQSWIQQVMPPAAPSNLMGPTFIFPFNQQQAAAAAASARPSSVNSVSATGGVASSNSCAPAMSFNYPGMAINETQCLAILQNNAYPFPVPHVGAPPNYSGTPAQVMPMFNGSFYPSQMIQTTASSQLQKANHNATVSSSSKSSQKHLASQQNRAQVANGGAGNENSQRFPGQKSQPSQQSHNQHGHPSHGQTFPVPIHPQNFALIAPPGALSNAAVAVSGSNNHSERKSQQLQQSVPPHSFAMSFGPVDLSSSAQNRAIFQSFPEANGHNVQVMAAAAVASQVAPKKNFRMSRDEKSGCGDSSATDDERKASAAKTQGVVGQSVAFTRSDPANPHLSSVQANNMVESSIRAFNVGSGASHDSQRDTKDAQGPIDFQNAHVQQIFELTQLHQRLANAASQSKVPDSSTTMAAKFSNAHSGFPQNVAHSSSPIQWKNSAGRTTTSLAPNLLQQHSRTAQMLGQISFGGNQKQLTTQVQVPPGSNQAPASLMISNSTKEGSGSPRTSSASINRTSSPKSSSLVPSQKVPSILGSHQVSSTGSGGKSTMQQQLPNIIQPGHVLISNPSNGFYMQRRVPDQHQQPAQQLSGMQSMSSTGVSSLCSPATMSSTGPNGPNKAYAATTSNVKGGGLPSAGGIIKAAQLAGTILPAGISYVHPVPGTAVQLKPAEQKQPAG